MARQPLQNMMGRAHSEQPRSGMLIEVVHYMTGYMEEVLHDVLEHHATDILKHNLIAGIQSGLPLHGLAQMEAWRNSAGVYPDALALAVIKRHAQIDHFWRWPMWLERGDNLIMLYDSYNQIQQKLLHVLLALNHVYYFGFKWLDVALARLIIAPRDLGARLRQVYKVAPGEGAQLVATLVEETYDLVEQRSPEVNVARLREIFRYRRPLWEEAPIEHV